MKNAILAMSTEKRINIGDYIQGVASAQFFENIDLFIEREQLHSYDGEECRIIMNGWYMHHPENWPPSPKIKPLFIAVHINSSAQEHLLSDASISYLKQHEPIGCRDINTVDMLTAKGINAYLSACMTLTLDKKYKYNGKRENIYFVDPICNVKLNFRNFCKLTFNYIRNIQSIHTILSKDFHVTRRGFQRLIRAIAFFSEYKTIFTKDVLLNSEYISHERVKTAYSQKTNIELIEYAEELINKYAKARYVVTSRLHCALPCLSLETPVVYTYHTEHRQRSGCRLDGILDLFNVLDWDSKKAKLNPDNLPIEPSTPNKTEWIKYKKVLVAKCNEFIATP